MIVTVALAIGFAELSLTVPLSDPDGAATSAKSSVVVLPSVIESSLRLRRVAEVAGGDVVAPDRQRQRVVAGRVGHRRGPERSDVDLGAGERSVR